MLLFVCCCLGGISTAQIPFNKRYYIGKDSEWSHKMIAENDKTLVLSNRSSNSIYLTRISISQFNDCGELDWEQFYDVAANSGESGRDFLRLSDSTFIICGFVYEPEIGANKGLIMKVHTNGTIVWQHTYLEGVESALLSIVETPEGGFLAGGYATVDAYPNSPLTGWDDNVFLVRLNPEGGTVWQKHIGSSEYDEHISDLLFLAGSNSFLGIKDFSKSYTNDSLLSYGSLLKLDWYGSPIWEKVYYPDTSTFSKLLECTDGGFLVTGTLYEKNMQWSGVLLKTDMNGNLIWDLKVRYDNCIRSSLSTPMEFENHYAATGNSYCTYTEKIWTLKASKSGELLGMRAYDYADSLDSRFRSDAQATEDGGISFCGYITVIPDSGEVFTQSDMWLVHIDSSGNDYLPFEVSYGFGDTVYVFQGDSVLLGGVGNNGVCPYEYQWSGSGLSYIGGINENPTWFIGDSVGLYVLSLYSIDALESILEKTVYVSVRDTVLGVRTAEAGLLEVSPNPAGEWVELRAAMPLEWRIYDVRGALRYRSEEAQSNLHLSLQGWQAGMYYYQATDSKGQYSGKFLICP